MSEYYDSRVRRGHIAILAALVVLVLVLLAMAAHDWTAAAPGDRCRGSITEAELCRIRHALERLAGDVDEATREERR